MYGPLGTLMVGCCGTTTKGPEDTMTLSPMDGEFKAIALTVKEL